MCQCFGYTIVFADQLQRSTRITSPCAQPRRPSLVDAHKCCHSEEAGSDFWPRRRTDFSPTENPITEYRRWQGDNQLPGILPGLWRERKARDCFLKENECGLWTSFNKVFHAVCAGHGMMKAVRSQRYPKPVKCESGFKNPEARGRQITLCGFYPA